ncbi:MAG: hypothetical protein AAB373_06110 [Patescibacteria group bacterium]
MADNIQTQVAQTAQTTTAGTGGVVVDKNKTAEQYIAEAEIKYIVPAIVREKFPDLVKLIYETESMNQEEREYWLQIMPIMSEEQIVKFREILVNERDQLAKLDQEYKAEMQKAGDKPVATPLDEAKIKERMDQLKATETASKQAEASQEQDLLQKLDNM